jgi:invasion protein IalB
MPISKYLPRRTGEAIHRESGCRRSGAAGLSPRRGGLLAAALAAVVAGGLAAVPAAAQTQIQPQPAPQGQAPAVQPIPDQTFGDWILRCTAEPPPGASPPPAGKQNVCFLVQQVMDQNTQRPLMKVTIGFFGEERQAGAVIAMPLGVPLAHGLHISVDGSELGTIPFQVCRRDGCQAYFKLEDASVAAFKAGTQAQAHVESTQGEGFNLPISLKGFTAGYGALQ